MNRDKATNSAQFNAITERIEAMRAMLPKEEPGMFSMLTQLLKDADALETQRKQDARAASTSFTAQATEFQKRFEKLLEYVAKIEAKLEAYATAPHGFGTFLRHVGEHEVTDRRGEIIKFPIVDIRDNRGNEGRVLIVGDNIDVATIKYGQRLELIDPNAPTHVYALLDEFAPASREATVSAVLQKDQFGMRVMITSGEMGEQRVCWLSDKLWTIRSKKGRES